MVGGEGGGVERHCGFSAEPRQQLLPKGSTERDRSAAKPGVHCGGCLPGKRFRVSPDDCPKTAGKASSKPATLVKRSGSGHGGWMDGWLLFPQFCVQGVFGVAKCPRSHRVDPALHFTAAESQLHIQDLKFFFFFKRTQVTIFQTVTCT